MNGIKLRYYFINIIGILISAALFINDYKRIGDAFRFRGIGHFLIIAITVIIVHIIKAGRLYLALYGSDITFKLYLKVYCKVIPVSMIIPYKLGEFFRMYCYGYTLNNMVKGIVIVILDRFMDTIALMTMILLIWIFNGGHITSLVYILMIFLILALIVYFVFPGVYNFWKHYMLRARATEQKLSILKMLNTLNHVYEEIQGVSKGRGIILYFMSLIAWGVEIGGVLLQVGIFSNTDISKGISDYLSSAMGGNLSDELELFVFASIILMIAIYFGVKISEGLPVRRVRNENNSNI